MILLFIIYCFIVNRCEQSNYFQCIYDSANLFFYKGIKSNNNNNNNNNNDNENNDNNNNNNNNDNNNSNFPSLSRPEHLRNLH